MRENEPGMRAATLKNAFWGIKDIGECLRGRWGGIWWVERIY